MVTPYYYPVIGGAETVVEDLSIQLLKMGITCDVMTFNMNERWKPSSKEIKETINNVKVIRVAAKNLLPAPLHVDLVTSMVNLWPRRFLKKFDDYDILHFHNDVDLSFPLFSILSRKPKIFHSHVLSITYKLYAQNPLTKLIFRHIADVYLGPSTYSLNLLRLLGISPPKAKVLPNGIDVERFCPGKSSRPDNSLLFVGRIDLYKGLHILLEAILLVKTPVHLKIIGPKSWGNSYDAMISELIDKIESGQVHKVTYMGPQKREDIVQAYQEASVLVLPSLFESFPVAVLEALSCETPVIASKVGGIPEMMGDMDSRVLVPPGDAAKLATCIQWLLDNKGIRRKLGEDGRKRVVENYSMKAQIRSLIRIYEEILN